MVNNRILLIRTDASAQIGSGHFMRCLALAQAWQEQDGKAIFLMAGGAAGLERRLRDENIREELIFARPGSDNDAEDTASAALRCRSDWIALDGYYFSPEYQSALRERAGHLLMFDDMADSARYYASLLLNQNAYATPEMYGDRVGDCRLLLGSAYLLLRREFRELNRLQKLIKDKVSNLLITFGGSDADNVTAKALQALAMIKAPAMQVRVLVGASNPHRGQLERLAARLPHSVEFETDSPRMAEHMQWADMAISAAGSTSWELAYMGLPSILITLSENQQGCAQYLHCNAIASSVGCHDQVGSEDIALALQDLFGDPAKRAEMSSRGRALIDGRGGERVVQAMASLESRTRHRRAPITS